MPKMLVQQFIRATPGGAKTATAIPKGTDVTVIEVNGEWSRVRAHDLNVEGWIFSTALSVEAGPLTPAEFAEECLLHSYFCGTNAHYLIAVAHMRSGLRNDADGHLIGVFRLSKPEWEKHRTYRVLDVNFEPDDITIWSAQILTFAAMTAQAQDAFQAAMDRLPTAAELYLVQSLGPTAGFKLLKDPALTVAAAFQAPMTAADPDPVETMARHAGMLKSAGQTKAEDLLSAISAALAPSLDATRSAIQAKLGAMLATAGDDTGAEPHPDTPLFRRPTDGGAAPVRGHLIRAMQAALIEKGHLPPANEHGRSNIDGVFGPATVAALGKWQTLQDTGVHGTLTRREWTVLTGTPPPRIYDICAQLTAAFEGTDFGGVNTTNNDNTVLTFGYHGYTLTGGNLQKFIQEMDAADHTLLDRTMPVENAKALRAIIALPLDQAVEMGKQIFLDGATVRQTWRDAFSSFGEDKTVQAAQLVFSEKNYWNKAEKIRKIMGLSDPLSHAFCFDVAVQNGGKEEMAKDAAKTFAPGSSEREKRIQFGTRIAEASVARFKQDVHDRKVGALGDGIGRVHGDQYRLTDWGFTVPEGDELDLPGTGASIPDNMHFEEWFRAKLPGYTALKPGQFLAKGSDHARNGLNTDPPVHLWDNILAVAQVLAVLKQRLGGAPISLNSVYRSKAYNQSVRGVSGSYHMRFCAADFTVGNGQSSRDWAAALASLRADGYRLGIGIYSGFVHVDTRGANQDWNG